MPITRSDGFVDLRVSPSVSGRSDDDSVWPSFTDIMTVVVLIFLVSLVVILMRNTELVQQLRDSVSETETMTSQRSELELRVASLDDQVAQLRVALERSESDRSTAEENVAKQQAEILGLLAEVSDLQQVRDLLAGEKANLTSELSTAQADRDTLSAEKAALLDTRQQMQAQIAVLEEKQLALEKNRQSLEEEISGLASSLEGAKQGSAQRQQLLQESEQLRARLTLELEELKLVLAQLQAEQIKLTSDLKTQSEQQASTSQSLGELSQERDRLVAQVGTLDVARAALQAEINALKDELASLVRSSISSERALQESKITNEALGAQLAQSQLDYRLTQEELAFLRAQYSDEVAQFAKERELLIAAYSEELDLLREQKTDLESKYNRLVRPARSTVGRYVVEVRFRKEGEARRYSIRPPGGLEEEVSETELHRRLSVFKSQQADKLYTKVIIDDNSVTHGEAWSFTSKILNRYDYYYQN